MNTTERIEAILSASKSARNSDVELWLIFAQKAGMDLNERQKDILRGMPTFETIRRTRQKLQEQGKYEADHDVNEARYKKFKQVRQNINVEDPEKLLESQGYRVKEWGEY